MTLNEMRKNAYTKETLLGVIESYLKQIERSGKEYPTAVLSDLETSMRYVLKVNEYKEYKQC